MQQGDVGDYFYVIQQGMVSVASSTIGLTLNIIEPQKHVDNCVRDHLGGLLRR